ncbi:uncharacterized protein [Diabrotica undecimpunctata]|uniref:uncharacterized protein n=1 Tax=Diabrotica undecimpunctata TaxID=50387 RepID=UPI003B6397CA
MEHGTGNFNKGRRKATADKNKKKQRWMTSEILDLMEERRKHKGRSKAKYKELQRLIGKKIKEAKTTWLANQCSKIEAYAKQYDSFNMHKKIKEMTNTLRKKKDALLKDANGKIIIEIKEKLKKWKTYITDLFEDNRQEPEEIDSETGPEIIIEEIEQAIRNAKNGKTVGPDEIPAELLKCLDDETLPVLLDLFNEVYKTGKIPQEWLVSTFVAIPKTVYAKDCSDYRTISLISHTLKNISKGDSWKII